MAIEVKEKFFRPILNTINKKNFKKIAVYYPSNYELNSLKLFKILAFLSNKSGRNYNYS